MFASSSIEEDTAWEPSPDDWAQVQEWFRDALDEYATDDAISLSTDPGPSDLDTETIAENYNPAPGPAASILFERTLFPELETDQLIDAMTGLGRLASWAQARQSQAIAEFTRRRPPAYIHDGGLAGNEIVSRYVSDEIACALSLTVRGANNRVELALRLDEALPETLAAWQRGDLDWPRVSLIADRTVVLDPDQAHSVEESLLPCIVGKTTGQIRRIVDRAVIAADPAAANARHERARLSRDVGVRPLDDGMSALSATLTAEEAALAQTVLSAIAKDAPKDDPRTMPQRRADALMDLISGRIQFAGNESARSDVVTLSTPISELLPGAKPLIQVVVGAGTLAGLDDNPAEMVGHGAIPSDLARRLAADGIWQRMLTDPKSGAVLDCGRTRYRPPAALADYVRARDRVCTFPICRIAARHCQLDHAIPYDKGGRTDAANLGALCVRHHLLKTHTGWTIVRHPDGRVVWTSPAGHCYTNYPDDYTEYTEPVATKTKLTNPPPKEVPKLPDDPPF